MVDYNRSIDPNQIDVEVSQTTRNVIRQEPRGPPLQMGNAVVVHHRYRKGAVVYDVPPEARADARRDYPRTEIMLAFPVQPDGMPNVERTNDVFAFLPIRSFGFRFVVQADFLLVANREDIMKEAAWNLFLRDKLPDAFMRVFAKIFASDPNQKLQYAWIRYLPQETKDVSDDFFKGMVDKLYNKLSNYQCIVSASNQWRKPEELVIPGNEEILQFGDVLHEMSEKHRGGNAVDFVHKSVMGGAYSRPLLRLGASLFTPDLLHMCLDAETWLGFKDDTWFVSLLHFLEGQAHKSASWAAPSFFQRLKSARIFPVHEVKDELPSLRPMPRSEQALREHVGSMPLRADLASVQVAESFRTPLFFLEEDSALDDFPPGLLLLQPSIAPSTASVQSASVETLKNMGLTPATKLSVVLALLEKIEETANAFAAKRRYQPFTAEEHDVHVSQVVWVLQALETLAPEDRQVAVDQCRAKLFVRTYSGDVSAARKQPLRRVADLYLHSAALQELFEKAHVVVNFVSSCYFDGCQTNADRELLESGLRDIGASAAPKLEEHRWAEHWKEGKQYNWPPTSERYDVSQFKLSRDFQALIRSPDPAVHESLLVLMDREWETTFKPQTKTNVTYYRQQHGNGRALGVQRRHAGGRGRGGKRVDNAHPIQIPDGTTAHVFETTTFGCCPLESAIKQMEVPTSVQDLYASRAHGGERTAATSPVQMTYQRTENLVRALGESVPFLQVKLSSQSFVAFLGVQTSVTAEAMLKALLHLQAQHESRGQRPSLAQVHRLYTLIAQHEEGDAQLIRKYFSDHPLLLVDKVSSAAGATREVPPHQMSTADMKIELRGLGVDLANVLEKQELRSRLQRARAEKRLSFVSMHDVRWTASELSDPGLFGDSLHFLDRIREYGPLQRFFTKTLGVNVAPTADVRTNELQPLSPYTPFALPLSMLPLMIGDSSLSMAGSVPTPRTAH